MVYLIPILAKVRSLAISKKGQTLVEYALVLAVISVVLIASFSLLSTRVILLFSAITNLLDTAQSSH